MLTVQCYSTVVLQYSVTLQCYSAMLTVQCYSTVVLHYSSVTVQCYITVVLHWTRRLSNTLYQEHTNHILLTIINFAIITKLSVAYKPLQYIQCFNLFPNSSIYRYTPYI